MALKNIRGARPDLSHVGLGKRGCPLSQLSVDMRLAALTDRTAKPAFVRKMTGGQDDWATEMTGEQK